MEKLTLKEKVYNDILNGIVKGEYSGGQILTEQELVQKYNVSKSPVREALLILSSEGILKNIPRCGYQVFSFTMEDVSAILEFRCVLESYTLTKIIPSIQPQQIAELNQIAEEGNTTPCGIWEHWDINMRFHLKLASYYNNPYIYNQIQQSMQYLKLSYAQFYHSQWNATSIPNDLENHINILKALKKGNLDEALKFLRLDLAEFCIS